MNVIIVEDEAIARQKLEGLLHETVTDLNILGHFESVEDTVSWLEKNNPPDIAFFDIQLSDATCFEIFERTKVRFPVIFLTAYDNYVMKAFDNNAIHYILKPVTRTKVADALAKVENFKEHFVHIGIRNLLNDTVKKSYAQRLIVRKGLDAVPLGIDQIAYFFSEHKISFVKTVDDNCYMIDDPLSDLEKSLNPAEFFRVNRQFLVHIDAIQNFRSIKSSKLKLELNPAPKDEVLVSKENAANFKNWIKGDS